MTHGTSDILPQLKMDCHMFGVAVKPLGLCYLLMTARHGLTVAVQLRKNYMIAYLSNKNGLTLLGNLNISPEAAERDYWRFAVIEKPLCVPSKRLPPITGEMTAIDVPIKTVAEPDGTFIRVLMFSDRESYDKILK